MIRRVHRLGGWHPHDRSSTVVGSKIGRAETICAEVCAPDVAWIHVVDAKIRRCSAVRAKGIGPGADRSRSIAKEVAVR